MLTIKKLDGTTWEFEYPRLYHDVMDEFNGGCEFMEEDETDRSEGIFKAVLAKMPDHIDAIHHLAMITSEKGSYKKARDLWDQAVRIGRAAFPAEFEPGKDRIPWVALDNRPFLRALHGLALAVFVDGDLEEALKLFRELLSLNPNDNQGARATAVGILLELGRFKEALEITDGYRNDFIPETLYGRALALFRMGRTKRADMALQKALLSLPRVGKELIKKSHRRPKDTDDFSIMVGGADEAYHYWKDWAYLWKEDPKALEWVRRTIEGF